MKCQPLEFTKETFQLLFIVVESNSALILGLNGSKKLELINGLDSITFQQQHIYSMFPDVFNAIGCIPGHHRIKLVSSMALVIRPSKKVPCAIKERLQKEVQDMYGTIFFILGLRKVFAELNPAMIPRSVKHQSPS